LLIIMTPHVIRNERDADDVKLAEAARMSWCLADVRKIHGDGGLRGRSDVWSDAEVPTIYPDMNPDLEGAPSIEPPGPPSEPGAPVLEGPPPPDVPQGNARRAAPNASASP